MTVVDIVAPDSVLRVEAKKSAKELPSFAHPARRWHKIDSWMKLNHFIMANSSVFWVFN